MITAKMSPVLINLFLTCLICCKAIGLKSGQWNDPELPDFELSPEEAEEDQLCRHRRHLPPILFEWDTCASCYSYMINGSVTFGTPSKKLHASNAVWTGEKDENGRKLIYRIKTLIFNDSRIVANATDPLSPIYDTFAKDGAKKDWADCCAAAKSCCEKQIEAKQLQSEREYQIASEGLNGDETPPAECPPTWDGWACWPKTLGGVTASSFCPPYIYFLTEPPTCSIPLEKQCTSDGRWYRNNRTGEEWTDYNGCGAATVSLQLRRAYVLIAAYSFSIVAIIPALIIFFAYKQLRVHRIILHQNLFLSMLLNGILTIVFKTVVMINEIQHTGNSLIQENSVGCRILLILTKYSRMTNYLWMFCEGFYLHKLIAAAFAEQKSLLVFYLLGWVFPILPTVIYATHRIGWADNNCWVIPEEQWEWVLNGPSLLSLIVNALFLINIIRVLVTKLRATHAQEPSQYRKAVRATLVLLPLFGLHFLVTIYRPPTSTGVCLWTEIYFYANDILDGIQGFLVALIFCYFNGEVSSLLKRTYMRLKEQYLGGFRSGTGTKPRRSGSLGRSVVSTHVYSSVPPSPEANCMAIMDPVIKNTNCNKLSPNSIPTINGNGKAPVSLLVTAPSAENGVETSSV